MPSQGAVSLAHSFIRQHVKAGDTCIDATAGRGYDAAFLCGLVGDGGRVLAFDIQAEAVASTKQLLSRRGLSHIGEVFLDSHSNMANYAAAESVACVVFNCGWLPGGDHQIVTKPATSIAAIEQGLGLLAPQGIISICVYYGKDSGFEEKDALLSYFQTIDSARYTVVVSQFVNRPNCSPIAVFIIKEA